MLFNTALLPYLQHKENCASRISVKKTGTLFPECDCGLETMLGEMLPPELDSKRVNREATSYATIDGKWWMFVDKLPYRELTDAEAANFIWGK